MVPYYDHAGITIYHGDCLGVMRAMNENSVDSIVTDPPYGLTQNKRGGSGEASLNLTSPAGRSRVTTGGGFMGQQWDATTPGIGVWQEAIRITKPGAHLLAFGGTRTHHRLMCAIEDAGWEIRDCVMWVYGSGFPKSLDVSKAIDKASGVEREDKFEQAISRRCGPTGNKRCDVCGKWLVSGSPCRCPRPQDAPVSPKGREWSGWGTALKPAWEPIVVARKPLTGTVVANVLEYGTGGMNIDGCRVKTSESLRGGAYCGGNRLNSAMGCTGKVGGTSLFFGAGRERLSQSQYKQPAGRWPANLIHDGSEEVVDLFPQSSGKGGDSSGQTALGQGSGWNKHNNRMTAIERRNDAGSAARFFYCAKASKSDRGEGNNHPTVKPTALMRYLCNLITPPGGVVLDPFMGSGSTGKAANADGFCFIGIEAERDYCKIAVKRLGQEERYPAEVTDVRDHK